MKMLSTPDNAAEPPGSEGGPLNIIYTSNISEF